MTNLSAGYLHAGPSAPVSGAVPTLGRRRDATRGFPINITVAAIIRSQMERV